MNDVEVHGGDEPPSVGDYYSEWYLLDEDFPDDIDRDDIDEELVATALKERREYPVANDLSLHSTEHLKASRRKLYRNVEEATEQRQQENLEKYDVPKALYPWIDKQREMREKMLAVLEFLEENVATTYKEIERGCGVSDSTVSRYLNEGGKLGACVVDDPDVGGYTLTPIGETALELPWNDVVVDA